ncbi:MAG: ankyrin repeat domain-containing protein [Synergistaceae bacterium]|nr:ankyrin repeat domain-containing protein [Synergistaceae bacterium]
MEVDSDLVIREDEEDEKDEFLDAVIGRFMEEDAFVNNALRLGANVNARDKDGNTALMFAAKMKKSTEIATLIRAGADVNAKNKNGYTPLMYAARDNQNAEVISTLIRVGADVNTKDKDDWTPLMYAANALHQNAEVISTLIRAGADVNTKDKDDWTPLMYAVRGSCQNAEITAALIRAGADVNAKNKYGETPLMIAAIGNQNAEITVALINSGADINAEDRKGETALIYAEKYNKSENKAKIIELLRKAGGSKPQKQTAASSFHALCKNGTAGKIEDALAAGANVNARDANGWTPLMYAARYNSRADAVSALIAAGADAGITANDGNSALTLAKKNKNQAVYLLINDYLRLRRE